MAIAAAAIVPKTTAALPNVMFVANVVVEMSNLEMFGPLPLGIS